MNPELSLHIALERVKNDNIDLTEQLTPPLSKSPLPDERSNTNNIVQAIDAWLRSAYNFLSAFNQYIVEADGELSSLAWTAMARVDKNYDLAYEAERLPEGIIGPGEFPHYKDLLLELVESIDKVINTLCIGKLIENDFRKHASRIRDVVRESRKRAVAGPTTSKRNELRKGYRKLSDNIDALVAGLGKEPLFDMFYGHRFADRIKYRDKLIEIEARIRDLEKSSR